jgi:hypothetical protein
MTFVIKVRGSAPMVAEYLCPKHGRFDELVDRDANGDPPARRICGAEMVDEYFPGDPPALCARVAEFVMSAPIGRVKRGEAGVQGKYEPPPHSGYMDTRALGEGQSLDEWRADRAKVRQEQRIREITEVMKS